MPTKLKAVATRVTDEEKAAITRAAAEDQRSVASWVRKVLRRAIGSRARTNG